MLGETTVNLRVVAQTCREMLKSREAEAQVYRESRKDKKNKVLSELEPENERRSVAYPAGSRGQTSKLFKNHASGTPIDFDKDVKFLVMQSAVHDENVDHKGINDAYVYTKKDEFFASKWVNIELRVKDDDSMSSSKGLKICFKIISFY